MLETACDVNNFEVFNETGIAKLLMILSMSHFS